MQIFPFKGSECVIWKNLHSLNCLQCCNKVSQSVEIVIPVIAFRNQHVTDPHGYAHIGKLPGHGKDIFIGTSCEDLMLFLINVLDIQHDKICVFHQLFPFFIPRPLFCVRVAAGIKCCVDPKFFCFSEQLSEKIDL